MSVVYRYPVHEACKANDVSVLKLLLSEERWVSEIDKKDGNGWVPVYYAVRNENAEIASILLAYGSRVDHIYLQFFCVNNNIDMMKLFMQKGVDVNQQDTLGNTLLLIACKIYSRIAGKYGSMEMVAYLVESGANIYMTDNAGRRAFDVACQLGNVEIMEYLGSLMYPN